MTEQGQPEITTTNPPPDWLLRFINPWLRFLLRSPLHFLVSETLLLLTVTGRQSGTDYTFPVLYDVDDDGVIRVESHGTNWWKNLRDGGQDVQVHLRGEHVTGHAEVTEDNQFVAEYIHDFLNRHGPDAASRVGLNLPKGEIPTPNQLATVTDPIVIVTIERDHCGDP